MADPRFYDNRGPFTLAEFCAGVNLPLVQDADPAARIYDLAGLAQAGPAHLAFFAGGRASADFLATKAGWCLIRQKEREEPAAGATTLLRSASVLHAYAAGAGMFYPEHESDVLAQDVAVHPTARIGEAVVLAPGIIVGPGAEIGRGTRLGAGSVIGRGVTIGRNCRIGANVTIAFAHLGDEIVLQAGVRVGGSGFGFASGADGHTKIPQLGRVIVQDRVEIGANSTIDRGALGDTVIGEGTKIDNLVQIGHNALIGRHCILAGNVGISGSAVLGDRVVMGGGAGVSDHVTIGEGARLAGMTATGRDLPGGRDYGGAPARPVRDWHREVTALAKLAKDRKQTDDG